MADQAYPDGPGAFVQPGRDNAFSGEGVPRFVPKLMPSRPAPRDPQPMDDDE
jgi:hypothetical protein